MAKLADLTSEIRVILKILGVAATVVFVIFIFVKGGEIAKNLFFPSPPPPPEEKFGQLTPVPFPVQNPVNLKYRINTLSGKLPALSDRMKVYKVEIPAASLVALDSARRRLNGAGFDKGEAKISEEVYRFVSESGASIQYNIVNNNFRISSNFLNEPPPARLVGDAATKEGAYRQAIGFLNEIGANTEDIDPNLSTSTYLKLVNGSLIPAISQNDAQFIRVDLFQKNLSDKKIYYPGLTQSPMYFIFRNENDIPRIVDASFFHYKPGGDSSDYGIKSADEAFSDLEKGNAYVFVDSPKDPIDITDVTTGYYIGDEQEYYLPIIIFSGTGFTAYVNALNQ